MSSSSSSDSSAASMDTDESKKRSREQTGLLTDPEQAALFAEEEAERVSLGDAVFVFAGDDACKFRWSDIKTLGDTWFTANVSFNTHDASKGVAKATSSAKRARTDAAPPLYVFDMRHETMTAEWFRAAMNFALYEFNLLTEEACARQHIPTFVLERLVDFYGVTELAEVLKLRHHMQKASEQIEREATRKYSKRDNEARQLARACTLAVVSDAVTSLPRLVLSKDIDIRNEFDADNYAWFVVPYFHKDQNSTPTDVCEQLGHLIASFDLRSCERTGWARQVVKDVNFYLEPHKLRLKHLRSGQFALGMPLKAP